MKMIDDLRGRIDYEEAGAGPTPVLVSGFCSTSAAWRHVMAAWGGAFRCVSAGACLIPRLPERWKSWRPSSGGPAVPST
jgi:hypothetical protein